ncbi:hypothetical protein DPMN_086564 [Dreissena polymorpha]|uniref:Uncharacterized protein n=1 Tax=Dreissena polymorpha TaxID=45954 RepID=A0A9D4QUP8_DREPO|nr:hypothetical protein DPMN_086564 [Dreissena polymorpha]
MNKILISCVFINLLTTPLVTSLPQTYPIIPLKHYAPVDVCLFICNICFDDSQPQKLLNCANKVCLAQQPYQMVIGLIKLGRTCANFKSVEEMAYEEESNKTS